MSLNHLDARSTRDRTRFLDRRYGGVLTVVGGRTRRCLVDQGDREMEREEERVVERDTYDPSFQWDSAGKNDRLTRKLVTLLMRAGSHLQN